MRPMKNARTRRSRHGGQRRSLDIRRLPDRKSRLVAGSCKGAGNMPVSKKFGRVAVTLAFGVATGAASAAQFDYTLYAGAEHSDNINLSPNDPISQNVLIPGLNFTFLQQGSTVQANVAGNLEYRDYLGNTFGNQLFTQLSGQVNWTVLPQRLDFTVEDYAAVQPISTLTPNTPGNQQQTNVVTLGPTLHFNLGDTVRGQAELRYLNSTAQRTKQFDSSREQGALRIFKDLGPVDQLSANFESQHVEFKDSDSGPNYNRNQLFGRYVSKLAHFDIDTMLGWSQLEFDRGHSVSTPLAQVTVNWRPLTRSTFTLSASRQYSDAAQDMTIQTGQNTPVALADINPTPGNGIATGNAVVNSQVYLERRLEAIYMFTSDRMTLRLAPLYRKLSYPNAQSFDETGYGGSAFLDYRLHPQLILSAFANQETLKYDFLDRRDKTLSYGLSLVGNRTPHWGWRLSLTHQQQHSTVAVQRYHENQIYFGVVFKR
jgi:hypothetical protein